MFHYPDNEFAAPLSRVRITGYNCETLLSLFSLLLAFLLNENYQLIADALLDSHSSTIGKKLERLLSNRIKLSRTKRPSFFPLWTLLLCPLQWCFTSNFKSIKSLISFLIGKISTLYLLTGSVFSSCD